MLFVTCYLFITYYLFSASPAYAAEEFATSYDVVYDIDSAGITTVTEKITLKNLTSEYYAHEFKLTIGATQISDVKASDGGGQMQTNLEQKGNNTTITVKFNQQVAGLGKTLHWTLQFKSKDFAQNLGKVWEVRVPKVASSTGLESYNLTLAVPSEFGDPTLISPIPKSQTTSSSGKLFLTFDKQKLQTLGVSATFGVFQLFDFDLSYHLSNNNLMPIVTSIALPPDTAYQDIILQRINPKPINVTVDDDGNYLAWFRLKRGEDLNVEVVGAAKLYTQSKVKNPKLSSDLRAKYTKADKYWEKDQPPIQNKLKEILGENVPYDPAQKAKIIFDYVVSFLRYDPSRLGDADIERLGAVIVLNNPTQAICMEFTDLFIALARAANIPARELDGFAYSNNNILRPLSLNEDILHSWPEYWDEKRGWVMVDPTWENTTGGVDYFNKLDLNHLVFVTKGISSQIPIPAGSYPGDNTDTHDVKVRLSENDFLGKPQLDVNIDSPDPIWAGFPGKIKVKVSNAGNAVYSAGNFLVSADKITVISGENNLGVIPPFGTANFDLNTRTKSLFDDYKDQIVVLIGSQKYAKDVVVKPFLIFRTVPGLAAGIIFLIASIYLLVLGGHAYRFRLRPKSKK